MEREMIIFVVTLTEPTPEFDSVENVILAAVDRESAKAKARSILGWDPDKYIVTPITKPGSATVIALSVMRTTVGW